MIQEPQKNKFNYGDSVKVNESSPKKYLPGELGSICGMDEITTIAEAEEYACAIDEWVYIVEFPDGSSMEIAECYLETDPNRLKYYLTQRVIMKQKVSNEYHPSEVVSISGYHDISEESLAKKFNLQIGDIIYIMKPEQGEDFLSPESFVESKFEP